MRMRAPEQTQGQVVIVQVLQGQSTWSARPGLPQERTKRSLPLGMQRPRLRPMLASMVRQAVETSGLQLPLVAAKVTVAVMLTSTTV